MFDKIKNRDFELFILDVFMAIKKIDIYTKQFDNGISLKYSIIHWDATMRELELIGESLKYLLQNDIFSELSPSYFRKIVNFRNMITHEYFGIDEDYVWNIVSEHLSVLDLDLLSIVINNNINMTRVIEYEKIEYKNMNNNELLEYLIEFEKKVK